MIRGPVEPLPAGEADALRAVAGEVLIGITLCAMRDCGERFAGPNADGVHELTWGVVLSFGSGRRLAVSWGEDGHGQPLRLAVAAPQALLAIDSVVAQDVSDVPPWSRWVGEALEGVALHTYECAVEPARMGRRVAWGLELDFAVGSLLVAAARHGACFSDPALSDEMVIAYTPEAIRRLRAAREGRREVWASLTRAALDRAPGRDD